MKSDTKPAAFLKLSFYGNGFTESGVGYKSVLLTYHGGRSGRIAALQQYQRQIRQYVPGRDGLLMSNTWGDRSYEAKLNEGFIRKEIDATFDPIIEAAHQAHKIAIDKKKKADAPLVEAENYLKPAIFAYAVEQERKRKAEDGRLWKIARKEEEDRRMAEALSAEAEGNHEEAEEIIQAPVYVPPVVVEKQTPTVSGVSMVTTWKFRIVDELKVPRGYLKVDEIKIGGVVRAMKGATSISGVEAYPETGVRSGSR